MTPEDVKIIFNNIPRLATFADSLTERLEEALGDAIEGGLGEDFVGKLFLDKVSDVVFNNMLGISVDCRRRYRKWSLFTALTSLNIPWH